MEKASTATMEEDGLFSRALTLWAQPMIKQGFRKPLGEDDAIRAPERLRPDAVFKRFKAIWEHYEERAQTSSKTSSLNQGGSAKPRIPSLTIVLFWLVWQDVCRALVLQTISVVFCRFGCVLLLRELVRVLAEQSGASLGYSVGLALGLCGLSIMEGFLTGLATLCLMKALQGIAMSLTQSVLETGLNLHPALQDKFRRGDLVTLGLTNFNSILEQANSLMQGIGSVPLLLTALVFIYMLIGPLVLVNIFIIMCITALIRKIAAFQGVSYQNRMYYQGKRLSVLNEMLQSMRFTKFYTLENHYFKQMSIQREKELKHLRGMKVVIALGWPIATLVPTCTTVSVLIMNMVVTGEMMPTHDIIAVLAIARMLYIPFAFLSMFLGHLRMLRSVISRWQNLLEQPQVNRSAMAEFELQDPEKPIPKSPKKVRVFDGNLEEDFSPLRPRSMSRLMISMRCWPIIL